MSLKSIKDRSKFIKEIAHHTVYLGSLVLELGSFLSFLPGILFPDNLREGTWRTLSKIYEAIGAPSPLAGLEKDYAKLVNQI